jgi:hypothetical protein
MIAGRQEGGIAYILPGIIQKYSKRTVRSEKENENKPVGD